MTQHVFLAIWYPECNGFYIGLVLESEVRKWDIFPVEKRKQTSHCLQLLTAGAKNDFTELDMTSVAELIVIVMCVDDGEYFSVLGDFTFK